jgi:soluble lytic murein transglycosylase-like protein
MAAPPVAHAEWTVVFRGGRRLAAGAVSSDPATGRTRIELAGGGAVTVASAEVARVEVRPRAVPLATADERVDASPPACPLVAHPGVTRWSDLIDAASRRYDLDSNLVRAVIAVESAGDPAAVSRKGAVGLMQLLPRTAAEHGCSALTDPEQNVDAGCRHLARLVESFPGRLDLVLAAYNAGERAVRKRGGVPAYRETKRYVRDVLECLGTSAAGQG